MSDPIDMPDPPSEDKKYTGTIAAGAREFAKKLTALEKPSEAVPQSEPAPMSDFDKLSRIVQETGEDTLANAIAQIRKWRAGLSTQGTSAREDEWIKQAAAQEDGCGVGAGKLSLPQPEGTSEDERDAFERSMRRRVPKIDLSRCGDCEEIPHYRDEYVAESWITWREARASSLPKESL